ncbi:MAG: hypothetical protein M3460_13375 [Actinomycetota bacterium]|nr:hypothetical protein [Actinomycetota bacterium]
MSPDELRAFVAESRRRQGLPPTVTDPATLERIAVVFRLMTPADEPGPPQPRKRQRRKPPGTRAKPQGSAA